MNLHHETVRLEQRIPASTARIFAAYLDPKLREIWSAPSDKAAVKIEYADVRTGGSEATRCGEKDDLRYRTEVHYHLVRHNELIIFSETLIDTDNVLMVALITFELQPLGSDETRIVLTDQITSFVGPDGIDGHRQGFSAALRNLADHFKRATSA